MGVSRAACLGKIDIPKGHVEPGESDIEAAIRECQEEAGINVVPSRDMKWGDIFYVSERKHKDVIVYLAVTDQDPVILPNPETKQYEHDGYHWLSSEQMKRMSYPYLHGAIDWAREMIESGR